MIECVHMNYNDTHYSIIYTILLIKTTAAQNEVALSYHRVRGLHFLAVVFVATIVIYNYKFCNEPRKISEPAILFLVILIEIKS